MLFWIKEWNVKFKLSSKLIQKKYKISECIIYTEMNEGQLISRKNMLNICIMLEIIIDFFMELFLIAEKTLKVDITLFISHVELISIVYLLYINMNIHCFEKFHQILNIKFNSSFKYHSIIWNIYFFTL